MQSLYTHAALFSLLVLALVACPSCRDEPASFDRVVLIVVDTLRRDYVGHYGGRAQTPSMDSLARRGTVFSSAISSFHQTTMSMAALFTGRVPALEFGNGALFPFAFNSKTWCGLFRFSSRDDPCIPQSVVTLAEQLQRAGFETLGVTSNPLLHAPGGFDRGFDTWVEVGRVLLTGRPAKQRALARSRRGELVLRSVKPVLAARSSDHFFLYVHYMDAHDWRLARRSSYAAGVEASDAAVGELLAVLEAEGLVEGTLIVLTADHGEMLAGDDVLSPQIGHSGNPSFEPVLRVPLILAPAVDVPDDRLIRSDQLAGLILQLVGVVPDTDAAGTPTLASDEAFTSEAGWRTYRRGRWKSAWRRDGTAVHLFDLELGEHVDRASLHPDVLAEHQTRLDEIIEQLRNEDVRPPVTIERGDYERLRALGYAE